MAKLETALSVEQILEGMRQLSEQEKRALASIILLDPSLEAFVEEVDDSLMCERAAKETPPEPFSPDELRGKPSTESSNSFREWLRKRSSANHPEPGHF